MTKTTDGRSREQHRKDRYQKKMRRYTRKLKRAMKKNNLEKIHSRLIKAEKLNRKSPLVPAVVDMNATLCDAMEKATELAISRIEECINELQNNNSDNAQEIARGLQKADFVVEHAGVAWVQKLYKCVEN